MDLYEIRKFLMEASLISDDAKDGREKLEKLVQMIQSYPDAEVTARFPKPRLRR